MQQHLKHTGLRGKEEFKYQKIAYKTGVVKITAFSEMLNLKLYTLHQESQQVKLTIRVESVGMGKCSCYCFRDLKQLLLQPSRRTYFHQSYFYLTVTVNVKSCFMHKESKFPSHLHLSPKKQNL